MANRIQIRRGSGTPTSNNLLQYELGWDTTNKKLYIKSGSGTASSDYTQISPNGLYLPLSGGTMTGALKLSNASGIYTEGGPIFYWFSGSASSYQKQGAIFTTASTVNSKKVCERFYFREYSYNSSTGAATENWDQYRLPVVAADKTSANTYEILTSKSAVTIAQGGTSATTAGAAANNLLLGLPTWTANPNDDTYFIRRDTSGGDAFGQVKASTLYNYIAGKTTVSNTWTAGTTAGPTIKTTVNGVAGTAVAIPSASASASGIVTTGAQTFAGIKTFTNPETINTTGNGAAVNFKFSNAATANETYGQNWISYENTSGRFNWREWSGSSSGRTSYYEQYQLPACNASRTSNATYEILTSKNAVTIAQGGTGATTAANAIKALLNGVAAGTGVVTNDTHFIRKKDSNYSTVSAYDIATYMINQVNIQDNVLDKTANYTLTAADSGKFIVVNSSSDLTITIPTNASSSIPRGAEYTIMRQGSGKVTINSSSITAVCSTTSRNLGTKRTTLLKKIATDTWYIDGEHLSS